MLQFGACPRCHQDVAKDRRNSSPIVCNHCGWVMSDSEAVSELKTERRFISFAVIFALILVSGFLQIVNWNQYSLAVIPLQVKELAGLSTPQDSEKMAAICMERHKYDCVERMYKAVANLSPTNLVRLAKFQTKREEYQQASQTFQKFFQNGGVDLEASYQYAQALGSIGQVDQAAKYYDYVLGAKPGTLQVTVVQNYVKLLMDANRYDQAKKLIENVRSRGANASMFMEPEFQKIRNLTQQQHG